MTILGTLTLRDWDEGCMKTLGAEIETYQVDGDTRQIYACEVPGLQSGFSNINNKVPCQFQDPEDVFQFYRLPCFQFRRNDMSPAFDRQPWYMWVARGPTKTAEKVILEDGTEGYTEYENQWRPTPFDITYDLMILARRQQEQLLMLHYALRHFIPPWFIFKVIDSKGDVREYDAGEMSISNTSELADIAERTVSSTISFTVRAAIDLHDDRVFPAVIERPHVTYAQYQPSEISEVNEGLISI
jgi:hypothetical protein